MKPFNKSESTTTPPPQKKVSIVYADDHVLIRQAISNYINLLKDFEVIQQCKNGLEVMQFLQHNPLTDILITDLDMSGMNGYETIQWVKINFPKIKILVLTVFDTDAARQIALSYGANAFVAKDIEVTEMEKVLYSVLAADENNKPNTLFLSNREIEFLHLLCADLSFSDIAQKLHISISTAEKLRETLFEKFSVKTRTSLALYVLKKGIVLPGSLNAAN
jgi:DNA-binding NarL/FixJ family response regulator